MSSPGYFAVQLSRSVTVRMNAGFGEFAASITKYPCRSNWNLSSAFASLSEGSRYARITFSELGFRSSR